MGRLDDRICIITGAARGQGESEARLFAAEGATVWLTDVLDEEGQAVATDMGGSYRHLDVRDEAAWTGVVDDVMSAHGRVDVLVNNAGIYSRGRHFEISVDDFNQVMDINSTGVFLGMRAVSPHMRDAGIRNEFAIKQAQHLQLFQGAQMRDAGVGDEPSSAQSQRLQFCQRRQVCDAGVGDSTAIRQIKLLQLRQLYWRN